MLRDKIVILCVIIFTCRFTLAGEKGNQLPNILVFIADDCTYRDLGCYGSVDSKTPAIDNFAEQGMLFSRCFQAVAMCSPTRCNLYTGIYPVKSGAYPNHIFVKNNIKSIVHYLAPKGYTTALLGKTHINPPSAFPFMYLGDPSDELDFKAMENFFSKMDENRDPFCLFVCSHQPHVPYTRGNPSDFDPDNVKLPPYFADTRETRSELVKYLAEVNYMDSEFKICLALLEKYNFSENTLVVFTSEQGNSFPFAKWTCYGNGLQTAFIARWPGQIKPGSVSDAMVEYVDVTPTLIDLTGQKVPDNLDGKSFLSVLTGEKHTHKKYVYGIQTTRGILYGPEYYGIRTVRSKDFRYILNLTPEAAFQNNMIADEDKNLVFKSWVEEGNNDSKAKELSYKYQHRPAEELYRLSADPYEMNNIADDPRYNIIRRKLKNKLLKWMEEQGDKGQETEMEALQRLWRNEKNGQGNQ